MSGLSRPRSVLPDPWNQPVPDPARIFLVPWQFRLKKAVLEDRSHDEDDHIRSTTITLSQDSVSRLILLRATKISGFLPRDIRRRTPSEERK